MPAFNAGRTIAVRPVAEVFWPAALLLLACAGCGASDRKPLYPAEGRLFIDARPATGAIVFLYAEDGGERLAARPHGTVGPDGTFRLSTYQNDDGVAAGTYRVAVFWTKPGELGGDDGDSLLPMKYASPDTSEIPPVVIEEGTNQLPTITLHQ
jgi:hypothetical protein